MNAQLNLTSAFASNIRSHLQQKKKKQVQNNPHWTEEQAEQNSTICQPRSGKSINFINVSTLVDFL